MVDTSLLKKALRLRKKLVKKAEEIWKRVLEAAVLGDPEREAILRERFDILNRRIGDIDNKIAKLQLKYAAQKSLEKTRSAVGSVARGATRGFGQGMNNIFSGLFRRPSRVKPTSGATLPPPPTGAPPLGIPPTGPSPPPPPPPVTLPYARSHPLPPRNFWRLNLPTIIVLVGILALVFVIFVGRSLFNILSSGFTIASVIAIMILLIVLYLTLNPRLRGIIINFIRNRPGVVGLTILVIIALLLFFFFGYNIIFTNWRILLIIFGVAFLIFLIYIIGSSKLSPHYKFLIIVGLTGLGILVFFFWPWFTSIFTTGIFQTIANLTGFSWIIAGIISIIGIWLISKTETKDGKKVHPHWKLGLFLIISGILFGVFAQLISRWIILSGVVATFYNLRWIVSLGFGIFGLILLFSKNYKVLGIFLMVLGIAFWFLIPFVTSEIAQKYGLKGQIAVEESGFIPRLKRFWFYVQNPEQYFARYGEFTNPNAQQKGPPKGLKFISFEPVVSTFRTDQSVRLLAEIKNYAIPSFKENIGSEKTEGDGTNIEKGGRESVVTIGFSCSAIAGNDTKKGKVQISSSCGNVNSDENKVENLPKNKDCSLFVYCDFEENTFKLGSGKNITTFRAILSANYENFITESVLRTYVIGLGRYNELLKNEQWELALLNELRNAASIPGLINNERKVISEYTGGPVELAVNILNPQPIYPESDRYFTLIVKSSPYAAEWEGNVKPGSLFLSVPSWFKGTDNCAFVGDVLKSDTTNALSKRLSLSTDLKAAYSVQDLKNCYNTETGGSIRGCTFICDFAVEDSKQDNIEEYTIKAFQTSNYFLNKSTTFDIIDLKKRPEIKKEDGTIPSKDIPSIEGGETKPQCSDDKDNDSDGKTDINDPGCYDSGDYDKDDNNEKNYLYACNDFFDNDGDGAKDEADKDCYENSDINGIYHPEYDNGEEEIVSP